MMEALNKNPSYSNFCIICKSKENFKNCKECVNTSTIPSGFVLINFTCENCGFKDCRMPKGGVFNYPHYVRKA